MSINQDHGLQARRSELLPMIHTLHLADAALAFESALQGLQPGDMIPAHLACGLRNHLRRVAGQIAEVLDRPELQAAEAATREDAR